MGSLENQVALITGGASGLGLAIVERFLEEGAKVVVLDKSEVGLGALEERRDPRVVGVAGDVRSMTDNLQAVEACVEHFGRLDCAIGNAGIWDFNAAIVDLAQDLLAPGFDEVFQTNVLGYLNLAKAALPALVESKGSITYTLSNAAFHPAGGGALYTASKHAVVGLVKQLAYEFAPNVRVNGVAPGAIPTNLRGPKSLGLHDAEFPVAMFREVAPGLLPVGCLPGGEDYAGAYVLFASRRDHVPSTGTVLNHDGGFSAAGLDRCRAGDDLPEKLGIKQELQS